MVTVGRRNQPHHDDLEKVRNYSINNTI